MTSGEGLGKLSAKNKKNFSTTKFLKKKSKIREAKNNFKKIPNIFLKTPSQEKKILNEK